MKLYHGTNGDFDEIDLKHSSRYKDFGQGFYLTTNFMTAKRMAEKKFMVYGGEPLVQVFEYEQSPDLKVRTFEKPDYQWAEFIVNNRTRGNNFSHDYDIVIGPIADDGVAYLLGRYADGTFTLEELAEKLKFRQLDVQYLFATPKSLTFLKRIK